jgi:hypothetical protein
VTVAQTKRSTVPAWLSIEIRPSPARGKPLTLCVGETKDLLARVTLTVIQLFGGGIALAPLEPTVANSAPAVASVTQKESQPTNYGVAEPFQGARFDLTGTKPGKGTLTFKATLSAGWGGGNERYGYGPGPQPALHATTTLDYRVRQCDYVVSAVHRWTLPNTLAVATMGDVRVTVDDQDQLHGSGQLEWILSHRVPTCSARNTAQPSGVDITGSVSDDGTASVDLAYQAVSMTLTVTCPRPCGGACRHQTSYTTTPPDLAFSVPADGGTTVRPHVGPGGFAGTAIITVQPVERTAVAAAGPSMARVSPRAAPHGLLSAASAQGVVPSEGPGASPSAGPSPGLPGVQVTLDLADGPFDLPDPTMGLADLTSYVAMLTVSFDGTIDGTPVAATSHTTMQASPGGRALTIDRGPDAPMSWRAEVDGVAYAKEGDGACSVASVPEGGSLAEAFEPARQLAPLIGASDAGEGSVDGVPTHRHAFDQGSLVLPFIERASGEVSVAASDGHVVRYRLSVDAGPEHLGDGVAGTRTLEYELTIPTEPSPIGLPADCPPVVDGPLLDDATDVVARPAMLMFQSAMGISKAVRAYTKLLKGERWKADGEPVVTKSTALLTFRKGKVSLTVIMRRASGSTTVRVVRTP